MFTMNWFHLEQQTAFVTGAGSGIGQGIALGLGQADANIIASMSGVNLLVDGGFVCW